MVLKWVNWGHNDKIRSNGSEWSQIGTQYKNWVKWSWNESIGCTMIKFGHIVLKGVNCIHNDKIRSNGLESSQLGTQYKNQVIWSWKESIGYTMQKSGHMVLKGVNWVHHDKKNMFTLWILSLDWELINNFLVGLSFKRPYSIQGLNLMILVVVFDEFNNCKVVKIHSFWPKTAIYMKTADFEGLWVGLTGETPQFSCSFQPKTVVSVQFLKSTKPQILVQFSVQFLVWF